MSKTQTSNAGQGAAETETPPLKISSTDWPMTHFHERASNAPNDEKKREAETENKTENPHISERLNNPLPGRINDLRNEHRFLDELVKGRYGRISRITYDLAAARHRLVRDAINAIENGPKPPRIGADDHAKQMIGHTTRSASRQAEISSLEFALKQLETDQGYIARMTIRPSRKAPPEIEFLLGHDDVIIGIGWLREALAKYRQVYLKNFGTMFPDERLKEIKSELSRMTDADTINALNTEATALTMPTADAATRAMRNVLFDLWQKTVEEPLQFLIEMSVQNLEKAKANYIEGEKSMFRIHPLGLEYKPTALSTSFDPCIGQFKGLLQARKHSIALPELGGMPRTGEDTILQSVFLLPILTN